MAGSSKSERGREPFRRAAARAASSRSRMPLPEFHRPDGRLLPEVPPPAAVPRDPVHALYTRHETQELQIHPRTAIPGWLGERLDVGYAIDVMHPLAMRRLPQTMS